MNLTALFPPALITRILDDLAAVADSARRRPEFEAQLLDRLDRIQLELVELNANATPLAEQVPGVG